jgi:hypothetical protein
VGRASLEADCDADKIEMLLQALEYRQRGYGSVDSFIQTAVAALRTRSGQRMGESAIQADPAAWWRAFARAAAPPERPGSGNGQWVTASHEKPLCRLGGSWTRRALCAAPGPALAPENARSTDGPRGEHLLALLPIHEDSRYANHR